MEYTIGKNYNGFVLQKEEYVKDIDSVAREFIHENTGAMLVQIDNKEVNKSFGVGFKTLPTDSTGVGHILEHSVLCGSKKYPVKATFTELLKGSRATFLNAATAPDYTMYPFASKNEKDFMNILDVYLDAVFYPNLYNKPEIFMQEGWHYELEDKDSELTISGVVYNEMKGSYSSAGYKLIMAIANSIFDNTYKYSSGGDPEVIPNLTYEEFKAYHQKYYHPSNAFMTLYGDVDFDKVSKFINDEYLSNFEKQELNEEIIPTKPFDKMVEYTEQYSIGENDKEEEKGIFSLNFVTNETKDVQTSLEIELLKSMLNSSQESPLPKTLNNCGICKTSQTMFEFSRTQAIFSIVGEDCDISKKEEFKNLVFETLQNIVKEGIPYDVKSSCLNRFEFNVKEGISSQPKGVELHNEFRSSWLQNADYLEQVRYSKMFDDIRTKIDTDYFEQLIQKLILDNNFASFVVLEPKKNLNAIREQELKDKLKAYKESLSDEELQKIIDDCKNLKAVQQAPDKKEDLEKIPKLTREDLIDEKVEFYNLKEDNINGIKVLHSEVETKGITYLQLLFESKIFNRKDRQYYYLLNSLIGTFSTKKYSYEEIENQKRFNFGTLSFNVRAFENINNDDFEYKQRILCSVLNSNMKNGLDLLKEILTNAIIDDKEKIKEYLTMIYQYNTQNMTTDASQAAMMNIASNICRAYYYQYPTTGYEYYLFLKDIIENFDERIDTVIAKFKEIKEKLYNKKGLTIILTGSQQELDIFKQNANILVDCLKDEKIETIEEEFEMTEKNEAFANLSQVNYVYKGYNMKKLGYEYDAKLRVVSNILSKEYLWNKIRVEGGAYGAGASISSTGTVLFSTYRDPNVAKSLSAFDEVPSFLANFTASENELLTYILGSIDKVNSDSALAKTDNATTNYMAGITYERTQKAKERVLTTTVEDIRNFAKLFEDIAATNIISVAGNASKIEEDKDLFKKVIKLA